MRSITVQHLSETRRDILIALKQNGATTIAKLASKLKLTGEAVRQQFNQLRREGLVTAQIDRKNRRGKSGRPATHYQLSEAGDHLFPKHYDDLSITLLDQLEKSLGTEALRVVMSAIVENRVEGWPDSLAPLSIPERLKALQDIYLADDPYTSVETGDGELRLIERNCPYYHVAMRRPIICSITINTISRLIGRRVEHEESFPNGDDRCVFRVTGEEIGVNSPMSLPGHALSASGVTG